MVGENPRLEESLDTVTEERENARRADVDGIEMELPLESGPYMGQVGRVGESVVSVDSVEPGRVAGGESTVVDADVDVM
jgi:hypothetical protein